MYTPKLKTLTLPNGAVQKIGWILVDEAGEPYKRRGDPSRGIA
jgi:hypothetical protein